jgi:uncharacterized protein YjbJ (UPF0337 family)
MGEYTDKAKGKAKRLEGRITGDKARSREGAVDEIKGNLKGAAQKVREAARKIADRVRETLRPSH